MTTGTRRSIDGSPDQQPTFAAPAGRRGKSGVCLFCGHLHTIDAIKAKGPAEQYEDAMLAVADGGDSPRKMFRTPRADELTAAAAVEHRIAALVRHTVAPSRTKPIPAGNEDTIRASGYGYRTYGDLMNTPPDAAVRRDGRAPSESIYADLLSAGISSGLRGSSRGLRRRESAATAALCDPRGAKFEPRGNADGTSRTGCKVHDLFADESKVSFQFDYLETGPGTGPGTWSSVSEPGLNALKKILAGKQLRPAGPIPPSLSDRAAVQGQLGAGGGDGPAVLQHDRLRSMRPTCSMCGSSEPCST